MHCSTLHCGFLQEGRAAHTLLPLAWPLIQELIPAASGVAGSTGRRVPITQPRAARPVCACAVGPAPSVRRCSPEGGGRRAELSGLGPNLGQQSILGRCSSLDTECLCICYECFSSKDERSFVSDSRMPEVEGGEPAPGASGGGVGNHK